MLGGTQSQFEGGGGASHSARFHRGLIKSSDLQGGPIIILLRPLRTKRVPLAVGIHSPASLKTRDRRSVTVYLDKDVISVLLPFSISGSLRRSLVFLTFLRRPPKPHSRLYPACIDFVSRSLPVPSPRQHPPQILSPR
jgi:hypothetical protein